MDSPRVDPKEGEKMYYARLSPAELAHARNKPFSDPACGKYLCDLGALLQLMPSPPQRVLDLGCGTGWTSIFLARAGYAVVGVDISPDAIAAAREVSTAVVPAPEFVVADYEELGFEAAFDCVLFYDALHHAENEAAAVTAAYRALKPQGILFAFEPGAGHGRSAGAACARATFHVHEKDMPPNYVWRLGQRAGFRRRLFLPLPHAVAKGFYRRDFIVATSERQMWTERMWGYWRVVSRLLRVRTSGLTVMWK